MKQKSKFKQTEIGMIPEDWEVKEIEEVGKIITGKTPKTADKENFGDKYPFITPCDMKGQKYILETGRYLSEKGKNSVKNSIIPKNSVCVSCIGSDMGKVNMTVGESITNQQINSIVPKISADFVYYSVLNISPNIKNLGKQSTAIPILNKSQFSKIEIAVPSDRIEMEKIAKILSDLDSKIELNQQMNKALEEISQAMFKRWFIDFEFPNEKGKPYKSSGGEMVDSELGEIPRGWNIGKIGNCMEFAYGKGLPETTRQEGPYPVLGSNGIIGFHSDYLVKGPGIVIGRKGTLGEVYWIENNFFPIDTTFYIVDKMKVGLLYFHYFVLKGKEFLKSSSDSAVPGLNRNSAYSQPIIIPSEAIISKFNIFCQCLFNKKKILSVQSNGISQIRDSLLPRLMSGKIRVPVEAK